MEKWNKELFELFTSETNNLATRWVNGACFHTIEYVNWLEKRATETGAQNTSHNKPSAPLCRCCDCEVVSCIHYQV
jgi:hypothetical protein